MDTPPEDIQDTIYKYKHHIEFKNVMDEIGQYNPNDIIERTFEKTYYRNCHVFEDVAGMAYDLSDICEKRRGLYTWCWYNIYWEIDLDRPIYSHEIQHAINNYIYCGCCGAYEFECQCL